MRRVCVKPLHRLKKYPSIKCENLELKLICFRPCENHGEFLISCLNIRLNSKIFIIKLKYHYSLRAGL